MIMVGDMCMHTIILELNHHFNFATAVLTFSKEACVSLTMSYRLADDV